MFKSETFLEEMQTKMTPMTAYNSTSTISTELNPTLCQIKHPQEHFANRKLTLNFISVVFKLTSKLSRDLKYT